MGVLSVILGVLLIICGFSCVFTPLATFLATGYILAILLLVYGVVGIIRCISEKGDALAWVLSILSVIVGIIALFRPGSALVFDGIILILIACWFIIQGVLEIAMAIRTKAVNNNWVLGLIIGILAIVVGIICFVSPQFTAITAGILIGIIFVEAGISLIGLGVAFNSGEE